jgi:hypothetical protein
MWWGWSICFDHCNAVTSLGQYSGDDTSGRTGTGNQKVEWVDVFT